MESLVTVQWLAKRLGRPGLAIIDASDHLPTENRDARAEFDDGHIPGAKFLDLSSVTDPDSPVPSAVPTSPILAQRLAGLGVDPDSDIVIYDNSDVRTACRAWFILTLHGLRKVAVLDGGLGKWKAEGLPLESGPGEDAPSMPGSLTMQTGKLRFKADLLANIESDAEQVVDARGAGRFTGEVPDFRPGVPSGHIPGSHNLPYTELYEADGTFKSPEDLRAAFEASGIDLAQPVVTTCGGGVTAACLSFALHLLGKQDVALYDGSWSEWSVDPATPKAVGAA